MSSDNIDNSNNAGGGSIATATIAGVPRDILLGILLGVSAIVNMALIYVYRDAGTEQRLQQYNLDWFKSHDYADLKIDVEVTKQLAAKCSK